MKVKVPQRFAFATALWLLSPIGLSGCFVGIENRRSVEASFEPIQLQANSTEPKRASVGQYVIVDKMDVAKGPAWKLKSKLETTIPGTMGITFNVTMNPCLLEAWYVCDSGIAFVAPAKYASATFNGKSVFSDQDELGIRAATDGSGTIKVFCDNGAFNGVPPGYAIWSRDMTPAETAMFERVTVTRVFPQAHGRGVVFSGVSGGKLTLTLEAWEQVRSLPVRIEAKDYVFDMQPGGPTTVSVQGCQLEVLSADSSGIRYRISKPFPGSSE
jgi:hypothetical protein